MEEERNERGTKRDAGGGEDKQKVEPMHYVKSPKKKSESVHCYGRCGDELDDRERGSAEDEKDPAVWNEMADWREHDAD